MNQLTYNHSLMIALSFFLPSMANKLNSFCDTRTLCSTYYNRELSHLNLGRGTRAWACGCTKKHLSGKKRKVRWKTCFHLTKTKFPEKHWHVKRATSTLATPGRRNQLLEPVATNGKKTFCLDRANAWTHGDNGNPVPFLENRLKMKISRRAPSFGWKDNYTSNPGVLQNKSLNV